jgi:ribosome-interacting GTPase 1
MLWKNFKRAVIWGTAFAVEERYVGICHKLWRFVVRGCTS